MTFFAELKRRNVVRVGIAYVVASWVLLQLTEVLIELFELSTDIGKFVVLLMIIGFIPAVIFAWAFELTPDGIKREHEVDRSNSLVSQTGRKLDFAIIGLLVVALGYFIWESRFSDRSAESTVAAEVAADTAPAAIVEEQAPTIDPKSIAVLPFDNRSRLEDDAFFVEGIHDDLLTSLARIGSLKVISRTSVGKYADTEKTIPEIAAELGVANVMEGAVQRAGDTVRINVQLINAETDEHLWAEIFDRNMTTENLFAIQSEISKAIAEALEATLSPSEEQRLTDIPTENMAAYQAYMRGRQFMARRNSDSLEAALREFNRAVELDPAYALAWVGVADTNYLLIQYGSANAQMLSEEAAKAVDRAMALDDQLGEVHVARANVLTGQGRLEDAEAAYLKAIELSPNYVTGLQWFGNDLSIQIDRQGDAVMYLSKAAELDPLSSIVRANLYDALVRQGDLARAEVELRSLTQTDPDFAPLYMRLGGWPFESETRLDEAIPNLLKAHALDPGNPLVLWMLAMAYISLGDMEAVERVQLTLEEINPNHWSAGNVATRRNVYEGNLEGAMEAAKWTSNSGPENFGFDWVEIEIAVMQKDYARARSILMESAPQYFEREKWPDLINRNPERNCMVGWMMMNDGDPALGEALLTQTNDFVLNTAPLHTAFPERLVPGTCLAALGDREGALNQIDKLHSADQSFFTWYRFRMPMFDDLRDEPRFQAVMAHLEANTAEQRANLDRMREAGEL
jgi:TolB-like protein